MGTIIPPVVVHSDTVDIFATVDDAELYLEPWAVTEEDTVAYDSEGRLLLLAVIERERPPNVLERTFGLRAGAVEAVEITSGETEPSYEPQLRAVLVDLLSRYAGEPRNPEGLPLGELVRWSVRYLGLTR